MKYQVYHYNGVEEVDVGFEVKRYIAASIEKDDVQIEVAELNPTEVCRALKKAGVITSANMKHLKVSDLSSDIVHVQNKHDKYPLCRLEKIRH